MEEGQDDSRSVARRRLGWKAVLFRTFSLRYRRIVGELCVATVELGSLAQGRTTQPAWARDVSVLVEEAWRHVREADFDAAWRVLHAARRRSYHGLDAQARANEASTLRAELAKIAPWRRAAGQRLLDSDPGGAPATLAAVALLRDEHYDNEHYKLRLYTTQLTWLLWLLAVATTAVVATSVFWGPSVFSGDPLEGRGAAVVIVGSGLMGACMSAVLGLGRARGTRVPTEVMEARLTLARPVVGAAAGVVAVGAVVGGYLTIVPGTTSALALLAFASGFSERLVLAFVERVGASASTADKPASDEPAADEPAAEPAPAGPRRPRPAPHT